MNSDELRRLLDERAEKAPSPLPLTDARPRIIRERAAFAARLGAVALVVVAAGGAVTSTIRDSSPSATVAAGADVSEADEGEIYAAVVRRLLKVDHTFDSAPQVEVVYVLDGPVDAADPMVEEDPAHPFSEATKTEIVEGLERDVSVEFVTARKDAIGPDQHVRGAEAVVALGPIEGDGVVTVAAHLYFGPDIGTWLTYEIEKGPGGWEVTRQVGDSVVS